MSSSIQRSTKVLVQLLQANVPLVSNRVYSPGDQYSNVAPRIIVNQLSPSDNLLAIGSAPLARKSVSFRIDIFDRRPQQTDAVAEQVEQTINSNTYYNQSSVTFKDYLGKSVTENSNGYFILLRLAGGTEPQEQPGLNLYKRTMLISGQWLNTS